ncbi:MAG: amidophosphoribosyltransferase [Campylobacteraceae bacterium]|nr:amidophosphoribosyltransferase [Campylobacteraceae bacterium]
MTPLYTTHISKQTKNDSVLESGGLFGIWGHPNASQITYFGLHALQHRGQTSAGIISSDGENFISYRGYGLITHVFSSADRLEMLKGRAAIGQVRSATVEDRDETNIQPHLYSFTNQTICIAHNGNLTNALTLKNRLEKEGSVFSSNSAAEILIHLIRKYPNDEFRISFEKALKELRGGFNFCLLTEDALYGAVDRNSFRPLVVGKMHNGAYILASETCALSTLGASYETEILAGQYIVINDNGYKIYNYTDETNISLEPMEFIYFARPDSNIVGINVHTARKNMGRRLAQEKPAPTADLVIGVPNSSLSSAIGYAEEAGLPYEIGLIKHQYIGRTFIQPTKELREQGVRSKLSAVESLINGKSVVLVDDSIVRGTTIKYLISLLKTAGAKEIHIRIASPVLRFPNYYGINTLKTEDFYAANLTVEELNKDFGGTTLGYLSQEGLIESIGTKFNTKNGGISMDAFDGSHSAEICDYEESFKANLTPLQKKIIKGEFKGE